MYTRIILVGFPGSGKSTIAKKIANRLHYQFVDMDHLFESKYKLSIPDFFKKYGEEVFRKSEHVLLKEVIQQEKVVISTGGGTPCFHGNMELIMENGFSIYIKMAPASLLDRLVNSKRIRPLVHNKTPEQIKQFIEEKLPIREQFFQQADMVIKGESLDFEHLMSLITKRKLD